MKFLKPIKLTFLILLFIGCSSNDNSVTIGLPTEVKYLNESNGGVVLKLSYEGDRIVKAWSSSAFPGRMQFVYNSNGLISRVYRFSQNSNDFNNFNWDISNASSYYDYEYQDNKLMAIRSGSFGDVEFTYANDLIVEKKLFNSGGQSSRIISYEYNSNNIVMSLTIDETPSGGASHTYNITLDEQVNPFYFLWDKHRILLPKEVDGVYRENIEFLANNVIERKEAEITEFSILLEYGLEGYPISYEITQGVLAGDEGTYSYFSI
ncbi:hypothetical protein [Ulvibacter litoralis]|uniref:YD repeat-containing protein n=1 Tax=Ulvibacter litoralis TaxID=227084 RepID=A0A1G7CNS2_9FLAO|nr:hypothetical protein [Ulvibacter litoralis]GHC46703.1 hypothetical protein GCM10008083_07200 [Ulvibacter litoralis]SDE40982.1 hypothetical protein SAMN05421855_101477 [Ulvibacter litoralis]